MSYKPENLGTVNFWYYKDKLASIKSTEQFGYLIQATQKMKKADSKLPKAPHFYTLDRRNNFILLSSYLLCEKEKDRG